MADVSDYGTLCAVCGKFVSCTATKYEGFGFLHEPCAEEIRAEITAAAKESIRETMCTFMDGFFAPLKEELAKVHKDKPDGIQSRD